MPMLCCNKNAAACNNSKKQTTPQKYFCMQSYITKKTIKRQALLAELLLQWKQSWSGLFILNKIYVQLAMISDH